MKETVKQKIIAFLEVKRGWVWGGQIEDYIRASMPTKASNASRVCRNLENQGIIERRLQTFPGDTRQFVQYRLKPLGQAQSARNQPCCPSFQIFKIHAADCEKLKRPEPIGVLL